MNRFKRSLTHSLAGLIAVFGERHAFGEFHREERSSLIGHTAIKDLGDNHQPSLLSFPFRRQLFRRSPRNLKSLPLVSHTRN